MQKNHRGSRRILAPLAIALIVLAILAAIAAWLPVRSARDAWRRGDNSAALEQSERWSQLRVWPGQYHQLLAAAYLTAGNTVAAKPHLDAIAGRTLWYSVFSKDEVAQKLFARGRYAGFLSYDAAVHERSEPRDLPLYRAAALAATGRFSDAGNALRSVDRLAVNPQKLAALERTIAQRTSGNYPLVFARDGTAIASVRSGTALVADDKGFDAFVDPEAGSLTIGAHLPQLGMQDTIDTTLDPFIQKAAIAALGPYRGGLVAIDPRTNEILAIASTRGHGALKDIALEGQYEPGSVIKVLTAMNAIAGGIDVKSMFPYDCKGDLVIDGRHFRDWVGPGHGRLDDLEEAFAQSCNIVFADIGLRVGADSLKRFMTAAGFDGQTDLGLFQAPLGKLIQPIPDRYETAFLAIGLEHETTNALHLAMIASMVANRGVLTTPRLLRGRRSIFGDVVEGAKPQGRAQLAPQAAAEQLVPAMIRVVESPKGTGRRAKVEGVLLALKTGTAGERKEGGLESVIMAFAPADSPKIAFGMIAEDAGPAEYAGAKIAHDFVLGVQSRLK
ncbi:MAG: penicillin-binding transpeptidase domain-containing protein [Thermoanaerobaculia bacterium]